MIYLIGGPVRVGKSHLARLLLERNGMPSVSTDALTSLYEDVWSHTETEEAPKQEWEMEFYPYLRRFLQAILNDYSDYVIEGAVISPAMVMKLSEEFELKSVFVGNTNITLVMLKKYIGKNSWLDRVNHDDLVKIPERIVRRSKELRYECEQNALHFVDLADEFEHRIEIAYQKLIK